MDRNERIALAIKNVERWPRKAGKADLLRHLRGERLTRDEAIRSKCYDCVGGEDTNPCHVVQCALTQYCPWNHSQEFNSSRHRKV